MLASMNQRGPRFAVGLFACGEAEECKSGLSDLHSGDLDFQATEIGMEILADSIGNVYPGSLGQAKFGGAVGHVPADGAGCCCTIMRQLKTDVALFHETRGREQTRIAGDEDRLGITVSQGLKLA